MRLVPAWPLDPAQLLEAAVAHSGEGRGQHADLVPGVLGGRLAPVVAHAAGELEDDPEVVAGLARRLERLADALDAPLAVRDGALGLGPCGGGGQDDVGDLRGRGQEDVLDDQHLEAAQAPLGQLAVGLRLQRVLADHVERLELVPVHRLEHARTGASRASAGP